jgi:hypothetical protein
MTRTFFVSQDFDAQGLANPVKVFLKHLQTIDYQILTHGGIGRAINI